MVYMVYVEEFVILPMDQQLMYQHNKEVNTGLALLICSCIWYIGTSTTELPTYEDPESIRREVATSTGSLYTRVHQKNSHSNQSSTVYVPGVDYADLSFQVNSTDSRQQPNVNQSRSEDDYDDILSVGVSVISYWN